MALIYAISQLRDYSVNSKYSPQVAGASQAGVSPAGHSSAMLNPATLIKKLANDTGEVVAEVAESFDIIKWLMKWWPLVAGGILLLLFVKR